MAAVAGRLVQDQQWQPLCFELAAVAAAAAAGAAAEPFGYPWLMLAEETLAAPEVVEVELIDAVPYAAVEEVAAVAAGE